MGLNLFRKIPMTMIIGKGRNLKRSSVFMFHLIWGNMQEELRCGSVNRFWFQSLLPRKIYIVFNFFIYLFIHVLVYLLLVWGEALLFPRLVLNSWPLYLFLPSRWNFRCVPLYLASSHNLFQRIEKDATFSKIFYSPETNKIIAFMNTDIKYL